MTTAPARTRLRPPAGGFSLVELMVSMAVGLLITAVVGQTYIGSRKSFRTQDSVARLHENGRFAITLLAREIRLAGYPGLNTVVPPSPFPAGTNVLVGTNDLAVSAAAGALLTDSITVAFFGGTDDAGATDGSLTNCQGTAVASGTMVQDRFFIAPDPSVTDAQGNAIPSLWCTSTLTPGGTTSASLVQGVDAMQILYGEDSSGDGVPDRYVNAADATLNMANVVAVRVSLLMRSQDDRVVAGVDRRADAFQVGNAFYHFSRSYRDTTNDPGSISRVPADGKLRVLYATSIGLRNRMN